MKKILSNILKWFGKNIKNPKFIIFILIIFCIFLILLNVSTCSRTSSKNTSDATDSTTRIKTKDGKTYIVKTVPIYVKDKEVSDSLKEVIKELKKEKINPVVITKTNVKTVIKNVAVPSYIEKFPEEYRIKWNYTNNAMPSGNYIILAGNTVCDSLMKKSSTTLDSLIVASDLTLALADGEQGKMRILVRSSNPFLKFTSIEGALINPRKSKVIKQYFNPSRWGISVNAGYGLGWNSRAGNFLYGPYIGIGLSYNLIHF